ncbi:MAG: ArsR family transcriptional regulator [Desulfuromonas sp.]|nr:MAG: ArsR family transcriptional regulator [Desulfuromonas sp.]
MKTGQSIDIMKALADKSRLAIVHSLLERSHYVEELAERHALARSTVSFHLRKLEQAGLVCSRKEQYYVVVEANEAIFDTTLRQIVSAAPVRKKVEEERIDHYRQKVLDTFFEDGRLVKLPAQHKKRLIILMQFARRFEPGQRYDETEVTGLIMPIFGDYCLIRRLLVDEGLIRRSGTSYWRDESVPAAEEQLEPEQKKTRKSMKNSDRRDIIRACKQNAPEMGIFQLRNKVNGKAYVAASRNLAGERNSRLFQMKMGKIVFSPELQQELAEYGADNFEFSVLAVLDRPQREADTEKRLAELELRWLEKLQPFAERGYNNRKSFERNRERLRLGNNGKDPLKND